MSQEKAKKKRDKKVLYVRVSIDEMNVVKEKVANSIYNNSSDFVRDVILNNEYKVVTIDQELLNRNDLLLQKTRKIGNNFNQLLTLLHSKKLTYLTNEDLHILLKNLNDIKDLYTNIEDYFYDS